MYDEVWGATITICHWGPENSIHGSVKKKRFFGVMKQEHFGGIYIYTYIPEFKLNDWLKSRF
jgi:hypothetical protein